MLTSPEKVRLRPTKALRSFVASPSPVSTLESFEWFAATDVAPAETTPMTCPATPSPVAVEAAWRELRVLLPSCALLHPVPAERHELTRSASETSKSPSDVRSRPTNALLSLLVRASPV